MTYEFIDDLKEKDYHNLIKKQLFISYETNNNYNMLSQNNHILFLGLKQNNKFVCCAKGEIKGKNYLLISNLYFKTEDKITVSTFINELKRFAKEKKFYKIKIIDIEHKQRLNLKVTDTKEINYLSLFSQEKKLTASYFAKLYKQNNKNVLMAKPADKSDIKLLEKSIKHWNVKLQHNLYELINDFKEDCIILLEKLDLVYYMNNNTYMQNSNITIDTIEELISEYGEEMIVGFSVILLSKNNNCAHCVEFYTIDAFQELDIENTLILKSINMCLKKKYKMLLFYTNVNTKTSLFKYSYEIILNPLQNILFKILKKED